jgi:Sec7-like guanine-nucleotide exchange factor
MTIEDYQKNLRGVNNNTDFSTEFLVRHQYDFLNPTNIHLSNIYTIQYAKGRSSCLKNISVSSALNMHGRISSLDPEMQVGSTHRILT